MCWFNIRIWLGCTSKRYCTSKDVQYDGVVAAEGNTENCGIGR